MEASAFPAPSGLAPTRISIGVPLLRLRSDEQLVASFRDGNNDAFRVIYDRYRQRLFAYTRQMLPGSRQDAEDALQDVFVRAFGGLRANDRELALRAWLYRIAHNRCIDELRRPPLPAPELMELVRPPLVDPIAQAEQRESLRRLIADVRRLPEQQRSALLMRELAGMSYAEIADALEISVPAVKSLLVRSRLGLAQAAEARDTACAQIRAELVLAHDRGVRPTGMSRRHMRDCPGCREFRGHLRGTRRQFAALFPTLGPAGFLAKVLGFGGGASGSAAAAGGAAGSGGAVAGVGLLTGGAGHVATILAAAVVTAGGAVEIQHTIAPGAHHGHHRTSVVARQHSVRSSAVYISAAAPALGTEPAAVPPPTQPELPTAPSAASAHPAPASATTTPSDLGGTLGGFTGMQPAGSTGKVATSAATSKAHGTGTGAAGSTVTSTSGSGSDSATSTSTSGPVTNGGTTSTSSTGGDQTTGSATSTGGTSGSSTGPTTSPSTGGTSTG